MAIEIHNIRLPPDIERGAEGGPMFSTTITETDNGRESSNINWTYPLRRFDISYPIQERENIDDVITFFYARRGRAYGFLFKDWSDFSFTENVIATGDGAETAFQLRKVYNDAVAPFYLPITRPVSGTLQVWNGGLLQTETTDYTVDYSTGIITFTSAPADTNLITAACEYNIPVRFDNDQLNINVDFYDAVSAGGITIKEIRE
jgi:uncharacterized protein (TIGR02217 family)